MTDYLENTYHSMYFACINSFSCAPQKQLTELSKSVHVTVFLNNRKSLKILMLSVDICFMAMATVAGLISPFPHISSRMAG